jgi:hypothetical protein
MTIAMTAATITATRMINVTAALTAFVIPSGVAAGPFFRSAPADHRPRSEESLFGAGSVETRP